MKCLMFWCFDAIVPTKCPYVLAKVPPQQTPSDIHYSLLKNPGFPQSVFSLYTQKPQLLNINHHKYPQILISLMVIDD